MNKVIVDDELNVKEQSFFNKAFSKNKSNFKLSRYLLKSVNDFENRGDRQIIYYVLYKIITENKLHINVSPIPKNGLSFIDLNNKPTSLGIYHCHLNNSKVLIWYVTKDSSNNLNLEIEYIDHPSDDYKQVLKNIYENTQGYNTITGQYFKDYRTSTYLKDSFIFIQKWFSFIDNF
jgi:hypothetical protein